MLSDLPKVTQAERVELGFELGQCSLESLLSTVRLSRLLIMQQRGWSYEQAKRVVPALFLRVCYVQKSGGLKGRASPVCAHIHTHSCRQLPRPRVAPLWLSVSISESCCFSNPHRPTTSCYCLLRHTHFIALFSNSPAKLRSSLFQIDRLCSTEDRKDDVGILVSHSTLNIPPSEELGKSLEDPWMKEKGKNH